MTDTIDNTLRPAVQSVTQGTRCRQVNKVKVESHTPLEDSGAVLVEIPWVSEAGGKGWKMLSEHWVKPSVFYCPFLFFDQDFSQMH